MTYKPGTIAKATVRGVPDVRAWRCSDGWMVDDSTEFYADEYDSAHVTDVRPLVVLDLDPALGRSVAVAMRGAVIKGESPLLKGIADQIEAQTRPAIEEPKGLGAVVEDDKGVRWVRTDGEDWPWDSPWKAAVWGEITPVRVLSEGVPS